ncbi:AI-2E family transporter [Sedimentibacter sp. zth1]|nr:AI-2E family transporter [Sedimentibacter sp. zth1]QSX07300.1 AI-2E family transporter [Sedimentibacter sp. zth1]
MELNKENLKKLRGLIVFTILVLVFIWKFNVVINVFQFLLGIISPFILGAGFAFILNVPMSFIERKFFEGKKIKDKKIVKSIKRPISLLITIVLIATVITLIIFVFVPQLSTTFVSLGANIQNFALMLKNWCIETFHNNQSVVDWVNSLEFNWEKIVQTIINFFKTGVGNVLNVSFSTAKSIISGIVMFFVALVFSIYIIVQKEKLSVQIKKVMYAFIHPIKVKKILDIASLTYKAFANFITGQCIEAVILGLMFVIIMSIIRLPYALPIGMLITVTALIPIFGAFIGCGVGAFLILMKSPIQALIFIIMFLILQQVEGNLIYPRVVGNSVGLPSIWVLVAVTVGGSLMGILGILIFIPLTSVIYTIFRAFVNKRLENKKIKFKMTE